MAIWPPIKTCSSSLVGDSILVSQVGQCRRHRSFACAALTTENHQLFQNSHSFDFYCQLFYNDRQ